MEAGLVASSPKDECGGQSEPGVGSKQLSDGSEVIFPSKESHEGLLGAVEDCKATVEGLLTERKIRERDIRDQEEFHDTVQTLLVSYQGILSEFGKETVRAHFLRGQMKISPHSSEVLESIDCFRKILLPSPYGTRGCVNFMLRFMRKLASRDQDEPIDEESRYFPFRRSFDWWRSFFFDLKSKGNWAFTVGSLEDHSGDSHMRGTSDRLINRKLQGCRISDEEIRGVRKQSPDSFRGGAVPRRYGKPAIPSRSPSRSPPKVRGDFGKQERARSQSHRVRSPRRRLSFSGARSDSDSEDCDYHVGRSNPRKSEEPLLQALRSLGTRKEVMKPGPFDPDLHRSLRDFLRNYERYFNAKFEGTSREMSGHLSGFLLGSAKAAYSAMRGYDMKYRNLKEKLIDWYEAQKVDSRESAQDEFRTELMRTSDSLVIYCLRLEHLAVRAYGNNEDELDQRLRKKLLVTAPEAFCLQVENAESVCSIFGDDKLSWSKLKKLAEKYDRKLSEAGKTDERHRSRKAIFFGYERSNHRDERVHSRGYSRPRVSFADQVPPRGNKSGRGSPRTSLGRSFSLAGERSCQYCKKVGHTFDNCWARLKLCLVCGGADHWMRDCLKMNVRRSRYLQQNYEGRQESDSDASSKEDLNK